MFELPLGENGIFSRAGAKTVLRSLRGVLSSYISGDSFFITTRFPTMAGELLRPVLSPENRCCGHQFDYIGSGTSYFLCPSCRERRKEYGDNLISPSLPPDPELEAMTLKPIETELDDLYAAIGNATNMLQASKKFAAVRPSQ